MLTNVYGGGGWWVRLSKSKPPLETSGTETLFVPSATEKTFSSPAQGPPGAPADWVPATKQRGTHALHSHKHQRTLLTNTRVGIRCEAFFFSFSFPLLYATHAKSCTYTKEQRLLLNKQTQTIHLNCMAMPRRSLGKIWLLMNNPISTWKVTSGLFQQQSVFDRGAICFLDEWVSPSRRAKLTTSPLIWKPSSHSCLKRPETGEKKKKKKTKTSPKIQLFSPALAFLPVTSLLCRATVCAKSKLCYHFGV